MDYLSLFCGNIRKEVKIQEGGKKKNMAVGQKTEQSLNSLRSEKQGSQPRTEKLISGLNSLVNSQNYYIEKSTNML